MKLLCLRGRLYLHSQPESLLPPMNSLYLVTSIFSHLFESLLLSPGLRFLAEGHIPGAEFLPITFIEVDEWIFFSLIYYFTELPTFFIVQLR